MYSPLSFPGGRTRPALLSLCLAAIGLTAAGSALADSATGLHAQAIDPYAASPSGDVSPGTPGVSPYGGRTGLHESRSNSTGMADTRSSGANAEAWSQGAGRTSMGLNLGQSKFDAACDPGFVCDDKDTYAAINLRNMVTPTMGGEIGLVHMGRMVRGGGHTWASGLNISLVGQTPSLTGGTGGAGGLSAFGKIGGLWGRTHTNVAAGSTLAEGTQTGFGLSLGAGLSWDFSQRTSAVLEWDRYSFHFAGGQDPVNTASIGLQWRY